MKVTFFIPPDGRTDARQIVNVFSDDAAFFEANDIAISMEQLAGEHIVYADIGQVTEDGEPDELIEFAHGRSCQDTLHALRLACEAALAEEQGDA